MAPLRPGRCHDENGKSEAVIVGLSLAC